MDNSVKLLDKNNENNEIIKKEPISNSIEPIETIQSSFKGNSNYDKRKNFQQIHHKPNHFNNYNNHQYNQNYYQNQNTMNKNRKGSIKYDQRYNQNYAKISNIDNKNKNNTYFKKKRNQDMIHNNDHNNLNDIKLNFIHPYKEADDLSNYKNEFQKIGNLNFLKQNWKQRRSLEDDNNDINNGLNLNLLANLQNQNLNNINYPSLLKLNYNQPMNLLNLGNLGNMQMNNYYLNLLNNKQNMNNIPNNVASPNKVQKNNNKIINPILNFPMNSINLNNNNIANLNSSKINTISNNPLSNISNMVMMYNQMNNNKYKNIPIHPPQNNQMPVAQNNLPNENTKNKSPQKINHMNNLNNLNHINNNLTNQVNNSFNSLIQFYFNTLQYQQLILNKMTQLFNPNNNNNSNIHTDIQNTINQLKTMLNNEMNQLSPILSQNQNNANNNSNNNSNSTVNNNKNTDENSSSSKENEKNNDKYIQNILSTWPKQKFVKPYSPLLKLEKNQNSLKSTNFIYNPLNTNNNTLNINTMTYSNLAGVNPNQNYFLNNEKDYNKIIDNYYDDKKIEELLKIGKCLTGVFRMNKSQNHGYITVPGINNDILVRGKNLYKCLNLDEVVVELFNFSQWKSLANKKTLFISHVNEENLLNNVTNNLNNDENKNIKGKSLDEEEENLKTKEERTNYINQKLYHLRPEGRIIKILKSPNKEKQLICKIEIEKNRIFAVPIDDAIPKILISMRNITKKELPSIDNNYKLYMTNEFEKDYINYKKKYFRVKIYSFASSNLYKGPLGYIVNEIGESGDIDTETTVLLGQYGVEYPENFSEEIMNEVKNKLKEIKITDEYIKNTKRKDFRNELVFTIDPYTSKDLDDAIHVKIIDEETQLLEIGVHIADPTEYVDENSLLDKEALFRGTSVYLVQKKLSMLPLILSEDVCSIMPKKDTLAISCIFRISLKTRRLDENFKHYFCLSVVNSKAKWDYDLVQKIIEKKEVNYNDLKFEDGSKPDSEEIFQKLKNSVEILYQLTKLVRKDRFESGSLMIDNDDIYFDLDENNKPKDFHISVKNESHNLIEELMLISNFLCAKYLKDNLNQYSLIRRHPLLMSQQK